MKSSEICKQKRLCSGCEACVNVCPKDAISMKRDWRGFRYPHIDPKKCIDCRLCQKRCPGNTAKGEFIFPESIAFIEKQKEYLLKASSGGAFGVMARYILSKGGVVYGAYMSEDNYSVEYIGIDNMIDLAKLHGSKYVQTRVGQIYRDVKDKLSAGRHVLFCGCPCHVAALNSFLGGKEFANLYTMDLICHGVPSLPYFQDYVKDLLKHKKKQGFTKFRFRCKNSNPQKQSIYVGYQNKDYYMTYFLWGKGYRDSCYNCLYAGGKRPADFTVGDYWNNNRNKVFEEVSNGSSLILFNTPKSLAIRHIFYENGQCADIRSLDEAVWGGGQLRHASKYDIRTTIIYILYKLFGLRGPKFLFALDSFRMKH